MYQNLVKKLRSKNFILGIIGLGYVGLPICQRFISSGIKVFGVDKDKNKISSLKNGKSYIKNKNLLNFNYFKKNKNNLSSNYNILKQCDVIMICLPTPLKNLKPDMSYVFECSKKLKNIIRDNQIIILESTVYPGATYEFAKIFKKKNIKLGTNLFLGYSPERENPGDNSFSYKKTPKVISGFTKKCLKLVDAIYSHIVKSRIKAKDIRSAELSKLLENMYRAINIGLVNELKIICDKLNIDVFDVIGLAATKNFGFQKFLPGPGLGGHCIPIDPFYLSWISKKNGYDPKFISLAGKLNAFIPHWIVKKVLNQLKTIKKKKLLLLGLSYKKNIDDDRESPSFEIMKILKKKKIQFEYNDPYFEKTRLGRKNKIFKRSVELNKKNLQSFSAVILITDHDYYNYKFIAENSKIIFDTRGKYKKFHYKNIIFC